MDNRGMHIKRVLFACVIACLLTSVISKKTSTVERTFVTEDQCIPTTSTIAKIEYFVMLMTRHFLILYTMYHIHRAAAPYLERRPGRL